MTFASRCADHRTPARIVRELDDLLIYAQQVSMRRAREINLAPRHRDPAAL